MTSRIHSIEAPCVRRPPDAPCQDVAVISVVIVDDEALVRYGFELAHEADALVATAR